MHTECLELNNKLTKFLLRNGITNIRELFENFSIIINSRQIDKRSKVLLLNVLIENELILEKKNTFYYLFLYNYSLKTIDILMNNYNDLSEVIDKKILELSSLKGFGEKKSKNLLDTINLICEKINFRNDRPTTLLLKLEKIIIKYMPIEYTDMGIILNCSELINYERNDIINEINKLEKQSIITKNHNSIRIKRNSFEDLLKLNLNKRNLELMICRINGGTLQNCGDTAGVTRERARQILKKIDSKYCSTVTKTEDDDLRVMYEKYNWNKYNFCKYLGYSNFTYYYLSYKYVCGSESICGYLKEKIDCKIFDQYLKENNYYEIENNFVKDNDVLDFFADNYIPNYKIHLRVVHKLYMEFCIRYTIDLISDFRCFEGKLSRTRKIIWSYKGIRQYNFNVTNREIEYLRRNIINKIDSMHSTLYFFNRYRIFMERIDIQDEYELHNILRIYFSNVEHIEFARMPIVKLRNMQRKDFYIDQYLKVNTTDSYKYVNHLLDNYGLKISSSFAMLHEFFEVIDDEIYLDNSNDFSEIDEIMSLKITEILNQNIYSYESFNNIMSDNEINFKFNNKELTKIGFRKSHGVVFKTKEKNLKNHFINKIENNSFILKKYFDEYNEDSKHSYVTQILKEFREQHIIFKFDALRFVTINKLASIGFDSEKIKADNFVVNETICSDEFYTLYKLKMLFSKRKVDVIENYDKHGFSDLLMEDLILSNPKIKYINLRKKVFKITDKSFTLSDFLYGTFNYEKIDLYEYLSNLKKEYDIEFERYRLINALGENGIYFSEEFNMFFKNKNYYYMEVLNYA